MNDTVKYIDVARSFVGTPFHPNGRLPGVGLDCIGVVVCGAQFCGLYHVDVAAYPMRPNGQLQKELDAQMVKVDIAHPGDILLMTFDGLRETAEPHHVAVYTGGTIIHAYSSVGKCVEQPSVPAWWEKVRGIYRFREFS